MKTAALIKRTFLFILIYLFVLAAKWSYENYLTNEILRDVLKFLLIFVCMGVIITLIVITTVFFIDLADGDYNQWFETHTDPIIKKVQDFFNRKNEVK